MIIYINGRGMNAPELKAYISELEAENAELRAKVESAERQKAEYKRLLKAAVEGMRWLNENTQDSDGSCAIRTEHGCSGCPLDINGDLFCKWKHEAEALALIGEGGGAE